MLATAVCLEKQLPPWASLSGDHGPGWPAGRGAALRLLTQGCQETTRRRRLRPLSSLQFVASVTQPQATECTHLTTRLWETRTGRPPALRKEVKTARHGDCATGTLGTRECSKTPSAFVTRAQDLILQVEPFWRRPRQDSSQQTDGLWEENVHSPSAGTSSCRGNSRWGFLPGAGSCLPEDSARGRKPNCLGWEPSPRCPDLGREHCRRLLQEPPVQASGFTGGGPGAQDG